MSQIIKAITKGEVNNLISNIHENSYKYIPDFKAEVRNIINNVINNWDASRWERFGFPTVEIPNKLYEDYKDRISDEYFGNMYIEFIKELEDAGYNVFSSVGRSIFWYFTITPKELIKQ